MTRRLSVCTACLLLCFGAPSIARAAVADDVAPSGGTIAAVPSDNAAASVRDASAAVLRPAPMPGDTLAEPASAPSADDAGAGPNFHPEILGMHDNGTGGALATASGDYDHAQRFRPAGGMGLTIPMQ